METSTGDVLADINALEVSDESRTRFVESFASMIATMRSDAGSGIFPTTSQIVEQFIPLLAQIGVPENSAYVDDLRAHTSHEQATKTRLYLAMLAGEKAIGKLRIQVDNYGEKVAYSDNKSTLKVIDPFLRSLTTTNPV